MSHHSHDHHDHSESPGFWKKLGQKTKAIFVREGTDTATLENLQATEHDNIIAEYNSQLRYVEEAIKTNAPDFHPSIEVSRLHNLRDEVDKLRAEETTLRENLLQKICMYFPVLLVLFPEDSVIGKQLRELMQEIQIGTFSQDAQALLEATEQQEKLPDTHTFHLIQQLLQQQTEKRLATQGALRQTLLSYQTTISDLLQKQTTITTQHKTPEILEQEIIESIKNYEGWDVRYSETPASDTFSAKMLMQRLQEYKERYANQEEKITQQQKETQQAIETLLQEYVEVITSAHHHLIQQQHKLRENYTKTTSEQGTTFTDKAMLFKKTRTASLDLRSTLKDIGQTKQFLTSKVAPEVIEKVDGLFVLNRGIVQQQQDVLTALRHDFDHEFEIYQQTSNVHNLNKLRALQKLLVQKYQDFISTVGEYQELEHNLVTSGQKLAFTETLNAIPHRPHLPFEMTKELGWTVEQLEELYGGFAKHLGLPELTLTNYASSKTVPAEDTEALQQRLGDTIFEKSVYNKPSPTIFKKLRTHFLRDTQEVVVEDTIPPALKLFRQNFHTEIKNTNKPLEEIIQIGEEMIANGEFMSSQKATYHVSTFDNIHTSLYHVSTFKFANIHTSFASSQDADPSELKNTKEDLTYDNEYNQNLVRGKRREIKMRAIRSNNYAHERADPISTYVQRLEQQGMPLDHEGKLQTCIQALQTTKGLSQEDALILYSYLTGQFGLYRTGQYENSNRGFVWLYDYGRGFGASDSDNYSGSLLFARDG